MSGPIALSITILSGVLYHLVQKTAPVDRPWSMLAVAYGAAFAIALGFALADSSPAGRWSRTGTSGLLLGLAALGIEVGLFYVYRSGWPLATASVVANVTVTTILAIVGIVVFKEHLTTLRLAGIGLAASGGILIARGG